jgi:hypothetical protein
VVQERLDDVGRPRSHALILPRAALETVSTRPGRFRNATFMNLQDRNVAFLNFGDLSAARA